MSLGVGHRRGSDLALLWLWGRLASVAPIGPLAWEAPYAPDAALKGKKKKKKVGPSTPTPAAQALDIKCGVFAYNLHILMDALSDL